MGIEPSGTRDGQRLLSLSAFADRSGIPWAGGSERGVYRDSRFHSGSTRMRRRVHGGKGWRCWSTSATILILGLPKERASVGLHLTVSD